MGRFVEPAYCENDPHLCKVEYTILCAFQTVFQVLYKLQNTPNLSVIVLFFWFFLSLEFFKTF
ncbi:hypothetical protein BN1184_AD_01660 [Pantoea ananatis]|nr:hypothetical protein BN1184_AD_01660 [Pantoea ananatis]